MSSEDTVRLQLSCDPPNFQAACDCWRQRVAVPVNVVSDGNAFTYFGLRSRI